MVNFYRKNKAGREVFGFEIMADYLVKVLHVAKINGGLHIYENGVYRPGEAAIHGHMLHLEPTLSDAQRREVFRYIKVSLDTPTLEVLPAHLIPFRSKIYDISADRFLDYSPEYVFLNRFPWDYRPNAVPAPLVTDTIDAISSGDKEVTSLIYEAFGNCFYLLNQFRGSVFLYGPGGNNGKSTLLNMLVQLLGRENCSYLTLQDTAEKFRLIEIYGKAANLCDDNGDTYLSDSSVFKRISTGGTVTAEKKGQDPISFTPFAKCFFALNSLPTVSDKSRAFFSRVLLIPLNADFTKAGAKDTTLKDRKWNQTEMEYLAKLSVDGLKRLMERGDFTRPECVTAALRQYEIDNNPVLGFLDERDIETEIIDKTTESVYRDFTEWCRNNGVKDFAKRRFSAELRSKCGITTVPKYLDCYGETVRVYQRE